MSSAPGAPEILGASKLEGRQVTEVREGALLRLDVWERQNSRLVAGTTTAEAGDFGVGGHLTDAVLDAYGSLATSLGFAEISVPLQVHGTDVVRFEAGGDSEAAPRVSLAGRVDGQMSERAGSLLASTAADCVPISLWHPGSGRIGLLHAGWKGVAGGILGLGLARLLGADAATLDDTLVHLGPSICGACYEVDGPVLSALDLPGERAHVDLRGVLVGQALEAGLPDENVTASTHCTACGAEPLHSHRGSGGTAGRMAAFLGVRTA